MTKKHMEIEVRKDPRHPETHSVAKVIVAGRVWACSWAGTPTEDQVRKAWREDRRAFMPYDESRGVYLG